MYLKHFLMKNYSTFGTHYQIYFIWHDIYEDIFCFNKNSYVPLFAFGDKLVLGFLVKSEMLVVGVWVRVDWRTPIPTISSVTK